MNKTTIEWTDYTWNPVTGCSKVSQGCKNCYAETMANRFWGDRKFTDVQIHPDRLNHSDFGKWRGKKVFVCSMSDLFHERVPFYFIFDVFRRFYYLSDITFQVLTKRPGRALEFIKWAKSAEPIFCDEYLSVLPNVWIGTSCEDQATANERIPLLLQIPAAVRFLSLEPLLGPIDLLSFYNPLSGYWTYLNQEKDLTVRSEIHWVIAGGESGHGARPMHPDWVRSIRDQCAGANVPFFFKQWGEWVDNQNMPREYVSGNYKQHVFDDNTVSAVEVWKIGKSKSGNTLDGKQHLEFPKL